MFNLPTYRYWKPALLAASIILLAACSANRLAYNNLDWLIRWKVGDYVSLDRTQKRWLSSRIDQHLAWHCGTELRQYGPLLSELESSLLNDDLDATQILQGLPRFEAAAERLVGEITPTVIALLRQLDDRQVEELTAKLEEKHRELEDEYTAPDLPTQHKERIERAEERLEDWLGPLDSRQYARLAGWSAELQGHNRLWLDNRQAWQQTFLEALDSRNSPDFDTRIQILLMERDHHWSDDFERIADLNRERGAQLAADMMRLASHEQKKHLAKRFNDLRADIKALQCAGA